MKRPLCFFFLFFFFYTLTHTQPFRCAMSFKFVLFHYARARLDIVLRMTFNIYRNEWHLLIIVILFTHKHIHSQQRLTNSSRTQHSNANFSVSFHLFYNFPTTYYGRRHSNFITFFMLTSMSPFICIKLTYPDENDFFRFFARRIFLFGDDIDRFCEGISKMYTRDNWSSTGRYLKAKETRIWSIRLIWMKYVPHVWHLTEPCGLIFINRSN